MYSLIEDIKKLLSVMLPILVAQISTAGITFINTTMAGHAGSDDLAGVSVGAGLFYPLLASIVGLLMAGTPLMATLLGEKKPEGLSYVVRAGLLIGLVISITFGAAYVLFIDDLLTSLTLEAEVAHVARYYLMTMVGVVFFVLISIGYAVASRRLGGFKRPDLDAMHEAEELQARATES